MNGAEMIQVSYRRAGDMWVGVVRNGPTVLVECGHEHENRDMSTAAGGTAARVCARAILDGARRSATADYVADRYRMAYVRADTGAGFAQPGGWRDRLKESCERNAADYLERVGQVRAALLAQDSAPAPAPTETTSTEIGDMPGWML